ncbi:glycine cleavage system aminomethyltransferase GcvT [Limnochorda pilosa]|uniref:Aminomethyltransferase n=1 Tax=Limnochorda pilosa TaxID=1555112 RepID=A0A0K2SR07_LIMPI|nr:glycine cleavage system aminomethyltransferase GcvT [Limnochorda pilosa]BAS29447.1 glycine cleavage system protein T [Limnochorda pilosa]
MVADLLRTPLREAHAGLGARLIGFAGWEMPVQYPEGILAEAAHVRRRAGLFDLSHMGEFWVEGPDAEAFLQRMLTNDVTLLRPGAAQYSLLCHPSGGILDDLVVYRLDRGFMLVVNAANRSKDFAFLDAYRPPGVVLEDRSLRTALIALQGPEAEGIMSRLAEPSPADLAFYHARRGRVAGKEALVSRTGYTGEDGFELYLAWDDAPAVWEKLVSSEGVKPAGLGARDVLRLEMAYPLYGNDIDEHTSPLEAGLAWVVKLEKGDFVGREAIARQKEQGVARRRVAFQQEGGAVPRHGYPIAGPDGEPVGEVTSGAYSPNAEAPIGMGYVPAPLARPDQELAVLVRGKKVPVRTRRGPFVPSRTKRPGA